MRKNLLFGLLGILVAACSTSEKGESPLDPTPPDTKPFIRFSSNINPLARATTTGFELNDEIGVFAFQNANGFTDNAYAKNIRYAFDGKYFASNAGISYPSSTGGLAFYAVYPYNAATASQFSFSVKTDQSQSKAYTQSDLMTASLGMTTADSPELVFDHRLSNVIINVEYSKAPLGTVVASCNAKSNASVNLSTNTFTSTGNVTTIKATSNGTNSYKVILPPQTITNGTKFVNLQLDGVNYVWTVDRNLIFKSGMQYTYDLSVDNQTRSISFTSRINPWTNDIQNVVPQNILDKMRPYMTFYEGTNPPLVDGSYLIDQMATVYCEDAGRGGFNPGEIVVSKRIKFSNQSNTNLTLDYEDRTVNGTSSSVGKGAFISGSGTNFTAYFNTEGVSQGIATRTALVVSGTKTSSGISNIRYAFVMVAKGNDPEEKLMDVGVFRIFKDQDGLAANTSWTNSRSVDAGSEWLDCLSNRKAH